MSEEEIAFAPEPQLASARGETTKGMDLQLDLPKKPLLNSLVAPATGRGKQKTAEEELQYIREKESAEAQISNFKFDFRQHDPDHRLRVEAIQEKTIAQAKKNVQKKAFAKHLMNSRQDTRNIIDSKKQLMLNKQVIKAAYYERRDALIFQETQFDLEAEAKYQEDMHFKFESNNADNEENKKSCMPIIEELNKNKQIWDGLILAMAIFNSFAVPLEYVITDLEENSEYQALDLIINIMFLFDIVLGFRTTYFDNYGMEVRDPKQIARSYLGGMFIIDFLSSIPYRYVLLVIPLPKSVSVFKILKIARISRFAPFVQKLELDEGDKASLKIFQLIITLVLILHCIGCFWFIIVNDAKVWAPPLDFLYVQRDEYNRFYDMEQVTQTYQFLCVLYLGVLALGGNEMGPRTDTEILAMFIILVGLILVNAYVFGQMSVLVGEASKKSATLQKQIDVANTSMNNLQLRPDTKSDIRMYLISTQGTQYEQKQLEEFFNLISPTLKEKVSIEIFVEVVKNNIHMRVAIIQIAKEYIKANPFPKKTVAEAEEILIVPMVTRIVTETRKPDDEIVQKLAEGEALYLIAKGECRVDFRHGNLHIQDTSQLLKKAQKMCGVEKKDESNKHLKMKVLRQGQLFGEISLIYNCKTTASVIAMKYCTIGKLNKKDFADICHRHPEILKFVKEGIFDYSDKDMRFIKMALQQIPFLAHLNDRDTIFYEIIYSLSTDKQNAGSLLMKEGDKITDIQIIETGIVEIFIKIGDKDVVIERLFKGSVINYKNVFQSSSAQVSMRCATETIIKSLSFSDLGKIRKSNSALDKIIQKFNLKVARIGPQPLDYIIVLPKKVYSALIDRNRERLLFDKQDMLMERLQEKKDWHKKYKGLDMDDPQIAETLKQIEQDELSDQEVIHFMTQVNHLELRMKNVAIRKLIRQRAASKTNNMKEALAQLITRVNSHDMKRLKLVRMNTQQLQSDGLVARLSDKISDTNRRIQNQTNTVSKIQRHCELLMPISKRANYVADDAAPKLEFSEADNIPMAKR